MNRRQRWVLGLICVAVALISVGIGSEYSSMWYPLLVVLYPLLLIGSLLLYLLRDRIAASAGDDWRAERAYLRVIAFVIGFLLLTLVALGV